MCGLVGMVGTLEHKHKNAMMDLLFLDTLRGRDSTGLTVVNRDKMVLTRKMTVPGYEFIEHPTVEKAMKHRDQLWIGHNRFKTTGEVSRANAHPFEILDKDGLVMLVGAHNGTLNNKYELERKLNNERYETDSEALFNWFTEAKDYKEAVKILRGAWSLVWWDATADSLHFLRNNERPLTYAFFKDGTGMVWASEAWMIVNACKRNGVDLAQNDKGLSCYSTISDTLYTLEIPQKPDAKLPDLKREGGYAGAPATTFQASKRWNSWWGHGEVDPNSDCFDTKREGASSEGKEETKADGEKKTVTLGTPPAGKIKGFGGVFIDVAEFDAIKERGCGWCGNKDTFSSGIFAFLDEQTAVCSRCIRDCHPKESVRPGDFDALDEDLPLHLTEKGADEQKKIGDLSKDSPEYKTLIAASVTGAKAAGQ